MSVETQVKTTLEEQKVSKNSEAIKVLCEKSRNLGRIMKKYPEYGSNSAELYLLTYIEELGSAKV